MASSILYKPVQKQAFQIPENVKWVPASWSKLTAACPGSAAESDTTPVLCLPDLLTGNPVPGLIYLSVSQPQSDEDDPDVIYNSIKDSISKGERLYDL